MDDIDRIQRETDVGRLRQMAVALAKENMRLVARIAELHRALRDATGADRAQLELELAALEKKLAKDEDDGRDKKNEGRSKNAGERSPAAPQTGHGPKAQPKLQVQEQLWTLEAADRSCPSCGGALVEWEGETDDSEEIDVIERRFVIRKHRRQKYRCACGHCETCRRPRGSAGI